MSSPVLQNENHIRVLRDLFDSGAIEVPRRMGLVPIKPRYFPVVLISNSAKLDLPRSRAARQAIRGLETVIKSEELHKRILDSFDDNIRTLRAMPKVVSASAVMDLGRQLVSLHRPKMPDFAAMFGLRPLEPSVTERASDPAQPPLESAKNCELCGRPLSGRVLAYLGEHRAEFGGASLCFECQRLHRRSRTESTA